MVESAKPSLLFLHGFGQSIERCHEYNKHFFKRMSKGFNLRFAEGAFTASGFRPEEKSWWDTKDVLSDLLDQRQVVSDELVMSIPSADVLMGFSQGANLVLHCIERRPSICKAAVICCGLRGSAFRNCESKSYCEKPVVFVFGEKDQFVGENERRDMLDIINPSTKVPQVLIHPGGHCIPQSASFVANLSKEIIDMIQ